jgi:SsrA-binding protein
MTTKPPDSGRKIVELNRRARFEFHIIEVFEAGIVLTGAEIKSIRNGGASIAESYVRPDKGEVWWLGANIQPYSHTADTSYNPTRPRKLLLHAHEIDKLRGRVEAKGLTIVPLQLYLQGGRAKLEIALARGKNAPDKRDAIKERQTKREMAREMK